MNIITEKTYCCYHTNERRELTEKEYCAACLLEELHHQGFRKCDIAACNCGGWHRVPDVKATWLDDNRKDLLYVLESAGTLEQEYSSFYEAAQRLLETLPK